MGDSHLSHRDTVARGLAILLCLPCCLTRAGDDAPSAVAAAPPGFQERYPDAAGMIAAAHVIPHLDAGYVPQGIGWSGELQAVVLSYYDPGGKRPSMFAFVDDANGDLLTSAYLFDGDKPLTGHVGGVAVHRGFLWTCCDGMVFRFAQPQPDNLGRTTELRVDRRYDVDSRASFVSASADTLWVGEFATNYLFRTARHHRHAGHSAWVAAYDTDENGQLRATVQYEVEGRAVLRPDRVVFLPQKAQGFALLGDMAAVSTSYSAADGKLVFFASPLGESGEKLALPEGYTTPGFVLAEADRVRTIRLPAGAEDLEWTGSHLLVPFEAGAPPYREQWRQLGALIEDRYYGLAAACTFSRPGMIADVTIAAQQPGWTSTGLCVRRGQQLQITAKGRITLQMDELTKYPYVDANGQSSELRDFEGLRAPNGCLLVRIGERVYRGGTDVTLTAETAGDVQVGILECGEFGNNDGEFDVRIALTR